MIAVHCGAGKHGEDKFIKYNKLCRKACRAAMDVLQSGGTAMEAVTRAIVVLEDDQMTNAGCGSNLTQDGTVECDASIMCGDDLLYGGCGAVKNVKNPIRLALDLCQKQKIEHPLGLIPPSLLAGKGAYDYAKRIGLKTMKNSSMVSKNAQRQYAKYKSHLDKVEFVVERLDTIGAVCMDASGQVAAGASSGGVLLKKPGRVGQAALYASGVWADSFEKSNESSIAVCTTGCGEHIVQTQLAKEISEDLKNCKCPTTELSHSLTKNFINSRYLRRLKTKSAGALVLLMTKQGEGSVLWGHSTETMSVGFMRLGDKNPKANVSILPRDAKIGTTITVGGTSFNRN